MKKLSLCILLTAVLFISCNKNPVQSNSADSLLLNVSKADKSELISSPQTWHITNKRILVLFGYDFNAQPVVEEYTKLLSDNFGLSENGGLILPVVYPDDFKHGVKGYSGDLLSILQDDEYDFCGVVLLGAPEYTHIALAKNQDKWNLQVPYPVIALFPQDEVLGIEATCDLVLDKGQSAEITGGIVQEETEDTLLENAPEILIDTIKYITTLSGPIPNDATLQKHLSQMLKNQNIHHYLDPETGLQSINHFVIN